MTMLRNVRNIGASLLALAFVFAATDVSGAPTLKRLPAAPYTETMVTVPNDVMTVYAWQGDVQPHAAADALGNPTPLDRVNVGFTRDDGHVEFLYAQDSWNHLMGDFATGTFGPIAEDSRVPRGGTIPYWLTYTDLSTWDLGTYNSVLTMGGINPYVSPSIVEAKPLAVNLEVKSPYVLGATPNPLFAFVPFEATVTRTLTLKNASGSDRWLPFELAEINDEPLPDWLTLSAFSGAVNGNPFIIDVGFDSTGMAPDTSETCYLRLFTSYPDVEAVIIPISLIVSEAPYEFGVRPAGGVQVVARYSETATEVLTLWNAGEGGAPLPFTLSEANGNPLPTWLTLSAMSGTLSGDPLAINVTGDSTGYNVGDNVTCNLVLRSPYTPEERLIPIRMIISDSPFKLEANPVSVTAVIPVRGDATSETVKLRNSSLGGATMPFTLTDADGGYDLFPPWLVGLEPYQGTLNGSPLDVEIGFDSSRLATGVTTATFYMYLRTTAPALEQELIIPVSIFVGASPFEFEVNPLAFNVIVPYLDQLTSQSLPPAPVLRLRNSGNNSATSVSMPFTLREANGGELPDWLEVDPMIGIVRETTRTVWLNFDALAHYMPGTVLTCNLILSTSVPVPVNDIPITIRMTVGNPTAMRINAAPASLTRTIFELGPLEPLDDTHVMLSHACKMDLDYVATTNVNWLEVAPDSGLLTSGTENAQRMDVYFPGVDTFQPVPAAYNGRIDIVYPIILDERATTTTVPVRLNVLPSFLYGVNRTEIRERIVAWQSQNDTFTLRNATTSTLNREMDYVVTTNVPWIKLGKTKGTVSKTVTDTIPYTLNTVVNGEPMGGGNYKGRIRVVAQSKEFPDHPARLATNLTIEVYDIPVSLNVDALVCDTPAIDITIEAGQNAPSTSLDFWNSVGGKPVNKDGKIGLNFKVYKGSSSSWINDLNFFTFSEGPHDIKPVVINYNTTSLPVGLYRGEIRAETLSDDEPIDPDDPQYITIPVTLTVGSVRKLAVESTKIEINVPEGQSRSATWKIWNEKLGEALPYNLTLLDSGVTAAPASGTIAADQKKTITMTATAGGRTTGSYKTSMYLYAEGAVNSPMTIEVTMNVVKPTLLSVTPTTLSGTVQQGVSKNLTMTIKNTGSEVPMPVGLTSNAAWLKPKLASVIGSSAGTPTTITIDGAGMAVGTYTGKITLTVTDGSATNSPMDVQVTMTVVAPTQTIELNPTSLAAVLNQNTVQTYSFTVRNSAGVTPMLYYVTDNTAWMTVSPVSGTATSTAQTFTLTINTAGLPANRYSGVVVIVAPDASNTPQSIPITLTVR